MTIHPGHFVAVFGGACAGSEAAFRLAERGIFVAVFEQQALPYGKIEDGLPKWHVKLRNKEEGKIDEKLAHPNIFYIPHTKLGRDISLEEILRDWQFSAVLLASGAWRDRPLPVEGIEDYLGKGFYYQNPFVEWFNHHHEPDYRGPQLTVSDNAIVVGGGLASIDVVKILMLETVLGALAERGIKTDILSLEHGGIPKTLAEHEVSFSDLNLKGCTLYYRRRDIDMPLSPLPATQKPEKIAKAREVRQRILNNARKKYLFNFQDRCRPVELITEKGRLAGLVFQKTEIVEGRVKPIAGSEFEVRSPLVISSIGSIPEPIPGIHTDGELFAISDLRTGQLKDHENVFALGNAVTGRGNIRESELHARGVIEYVMDDFLQWRVEDYVAASEQGWSKISELPTRQVLREKQIAALLKRIESRQGEVGYDGNYHKWLEQHCPVRLEELLAKSQS